ARSARIVPSIVRTVCDSWPRLLARRWWHEFSMPPTRDFWEVFRKSTEQAFSLTPFAKSGLREVAKGGALPEELSAGLHQACVGVGGAELHQLSRIGRKPIQIDHGGLVFIFVVSVKPSRGVTDLLFAGGQKFFALDSGEIEGLGRGRKARKQ